MRQPERKVQAGMTELLPTRAMTELWKLLQMLRAIQSGVGWKAAAAAAAAAAGEGQVQVTQGSKGGGPPAVSAWLGLGSQSALTTEVPKYGILRNVTPHPMVPHFMLWTTPDEGCMEDW